jgi:Glucose inhibited division protein A
VRVTLKEAKSCTVGYEEAAAQGLVAGVNAARVAAGTSVVTFPRENSYLGTLIDDLVTKVRFGRGALSLSGQHACWCQRSLSLKASSRGMQYMRASGRPCAYSERGL